MKRPPLQRLVQAALAMLSRRRRASAVRARLLLGWDTDSGPDELATGQTTGLTKAHF